MFKGVTYTGFEGRPEARAKAEGLTRAVEAEIPEAAGPVTVAWRYRISGRFELTLHDELHGDAASDTFDPAEADRDPMFFPHFARFLYLDGIQSSMNRWIEGLKRRWAEDDAAAMAGA